MDVNSDTESQLTDYSEKVENDGVESEISEESSMEGDDDSSDEKDDTPSQPVTDGLINETYRKYDHKLNEMIEKLEQEGHSTKAAKCIAYKRLLPKYRRSFRSGFGRFLIKCRNIRKEPIYKAVIKTAKDLKDNDELGTDEAIKCALSKRKFLLYKEFPSDGEESDSDEEDDGDDDTDDDQ